MTPGTSQPRTDRDDVQELHEGRWRPAVPLPLYLPLHVRCYCGRRFWGWRIQVQRGSASERYENHYRAAHIEWTERGPCMPEPPHAGRGTPDGDTQ